MIEENYIPGHWSLKTIHDVSEVILGNSPPGESYNEDGDGPPFIQGATVFGDKIPKTERYTNEPSKLCEDGDTIIAIRATIGDLNKADKEYCLGRGAAAIRAGDEVIQDYIHKYLEAVDRLGYWQEVSTGATFNSITKTNIQELSIPVPPLDEQKRIVEAIEERLNAIKVLEQSVQHVGELSNEYEDSLLSFLLVGQNDLSDSGIGEMPTEENIPDHWGLKTASEVVDVNPRMSLDEKEEYAHVPMDAVSAEEQRITRYERRDSLYSGLAKFEEGDIIIARITPCFENGKMAIVSELPSGHDGAVGSTEFAVLRPEGISTEYLFEYLRSPIVRQWGENRLLGATGRERIKINQFKNELKIPIPPKEEQEKLVNQLRSIDMNALRQSVNKTEALFDEYRGSVLSHAFQGDMEY